MIIYEYDNTPVDVELPDKPIANIAVHVISGDETGTVQFIDGTYIRFDASKTRIFGFDDGGYIVSGKDIQRWLDFTPCKACTASYLRQRQFSCLDEYWDSE